jgi:hypothetical protein
LSGSDTLQRAAAGEERGISPTAGLQVFLNNLFTFNQTKSGDIYGTSEEVVNLFAQKLDFLQSTQNSVDSVFFAIDRAGPQKSAKYVAPFLTFAHSDQTTSSQYIKLVLKQYYRFSRRAFRIHNAASLLSSAAF